LTLLTARRKLRFDRFARLFEMRQKATRTEIAEDATRLHRAALETALPLLREQLRHIVESCSHVSRVTSVEIYYLRGTLDEDEQEWARPWREAVAAVETALGLPVSNDDGGVRYE
jgi:hypothetical protein